MTERPARSGRRRHPASVGRVLAAGASAAATLSLVAVMGASADEAGTADETAVDDGGALADALVPDTLTVLPEPAAPAPADPPVTVVVRRHITVVGPAAGTPGAASAGVRSPSPSGGGITTSGAVPGTPPATRAAPVPTTTPQVRPATPAPAPRRPAPAATSRSTG